ncbi:sodium-dependent transporter [Desulfuribacillus alkaliarsenatis]|uniref:Na+-dependent transporter n=1 Tax=Desulfuribacillus alkaliarsenatis TaxID=766136 RepID=A0A1E5G7M0_9FIRM|nr:sodium-dependent transporter [Desulfuribacillus alkaliarsenatis]OEF98734.1 Na+-dependent transporter [Desulfuribacillus alkaliarsenatis]
MAREQWTSNLGFILAAAGSAVGLGNIWRFSYVVGTEGGAAFVLIYLVTIFLIGYPLLTTEIALGRKTQKNPVGAFKALAPNSPWWLVGAMGVLAGFVILSFYSIVAGWSLAYVFKALGGFNAGDDFTGMFVGHITSVWPPIIWHAVFMALTIGIIASGVVNGIQRATKILMPVLFLLLIVLVVRGLTLEGAGAGVAFFLTPNLGDVTGETFLRAVGQSFFTLSLGMGALITYGSYLKREDNISDSAGWVVGLDTGVAIIAGFAIFPAVFALGFDPASGAGLAFMTLPAVFAAMPAGTIFGFMFFLLLSVAALTSAISLLEVVVAWVVDEKGWTRKQAALTIGGIIFLTGLPPTLGMSLWSNVTFLGMDILDTYDFFASDILLPLGGLLTAIFAAHVWKTKNAVEEINSPKGTIVFGNWYTILVGYIIPISVAVVMVWGLYTKLFS